MLHLGPVRIATNETLTSAARKAVETTFGRADLAFLRIPSNDALWATADIGREWAQRFDELIWIGIGGSSLGPKVVAGLSSKSRSVNFADNVDAELLADIAVRAQGAGSRLGIVAVSKSGSTMETLATLDYFRLKFPQLAPEAFHVLTESEDNVLAKWARQTGAGVTLIPSNIGGRYSVLTPVGMSLAAYLGLDLEAFRRGAAAALQDKAAVATAVAQTLASFERGEYITNFWFYSSKARDFGDWIQQLWAESLGKKSDRKGRPGPRASAPLISIGAADQHSILQQVMEGARDRFVWVWRFDSAEAGEPLTSVQFDSLRGLEGQPIGKLLAVEAEATEHTLHESKVSTLGLRSARLDESHLGHHFMFMQLLVASIAESLDIDAFDQPGVELGKRLARELLAKA